MFKINNLTAQYLNLENVARAVRHQCPRAGHVYVKFFLKTAFVCDINVSFERGEAGEAGWMKYFTDVVPQFEILKTWNFKSAAIAQ